MLEYKIADMRSNLSKDELDEVLTDTPAGYWVRDRRFSKLRCNLNLSKMEARSEVRVLLGIR